MSRVMRASDVVFTNVGGGTFAGSDGTGEGTVAPCAGVARGPAQAARPNDSTGAAKTASQTRRARIVEFKRCEGEGGTNGDTGITAISGLETGC